MCYSALIREDLERTRRRFNARVDIEAFATLYKQREIFPELKIPAGLIASLLKYSGIGSVKSRISDADARFQAQEQERAAIALAELDGEIEQLAAAQEKKPSRTGLERLAAKRRKRTKLLRPPAIAAGDYRIYPYQFAPIIVDDGGERVIVPARYRLLPRTGVEVPAKYNVFNARRDSLQSVRSWKPLFGRQHALFPFLRFFEWVEPEGKSVELSFAPEGIDGMWAASLYEVCQIPGVGPVRSFAMVTDEPPAEVAAAGHDRCPVFLDESLIDRWLQPQGQSLTDLDEMLDHKEPAFYAHQLAA